MGTTQLSSPTDRLGPVKLTQWKAMIIKIKNDGRAKSKAPIIRETDNVGITQRAIKELFQQIQLK